MTKWLLIVFITNAQPQVILMDDESACVNARVQLNEQFRGRVEGFWHTVCVPVATQ